MTAFQKISEIPVWYETVNKVRDIAYDQVWLKIGDQIRSYAGDRVWYPVSIKVSDPVSVIILRQFK